MSGLLSLGELRRTTGSFETVLLTLFHSWVTSEEASLLKLWTKCFTIVLKKSSCYAVTDSTSLTRNATACNSANDIELAVSFCKNERLTNDELQCFKTEIFINISVVNCDFACTLIKSYSCNRAFSSTSTVKIRCLILHLNIASFLISNKMHQG